MMGTGMLWGVLLAVLLLLGFAYIIWVSAIKESGGTKLTGQVIAIIIAVLALLILLYGGIYGGMMGKGVCGREGMMGRSGMMMGGGRMGSGMMMQQMEMMPESERNKMMQEMMEKYGK